jgi:hypothetical protein
MFAACFDGRVGVVLRLLGIWPKRGGAAARSEKVVHPLDVPAKQLDRRHAGSFDRFAD